MKLNEISCIDNRNPGDLSSLIEAIKATGGKLLQPILLKSGSTAGSKLYEVVDGRRRFQALQLMGRTELEASEYRLTEDDLNGEVVAYIANTERKALSPLEEANQICQMLKTMEAEEIAEKLGKTLHYVVSRSRLAELEGKWKQVLAEPEKYPQWTIGKLQMIAREPANTQQEIEHLIDNTHTLNELWNRIQYHHRQLKNAPFKWQNICRICQKRSDNQGILFDEDQQEATCLDKECYERQCLNAVKKQVQENTKLTMVRSTGGIYNGEAEKFADKNKVPASWQVSYKEVTDPAEADAIVCTGDKIGKLVKLTSKPTAKTSADTAADKKAEAAKKAEIKEKREILRLAVEQLIQEVSAIKSWEVLIPPVQQSVWKMLLITGIGGASIYNWNAKSLAEENENFEDALLRKFIGYITNHLRTMKDHPQLQPEWSFPQEFCKVLQFDWQGHFMKLATIEHATTKKSKK